MESSRGRRQSVPCTISLPLVDEGAGQATTRRASNECEARPAITQTSGRTSSGKSSFLGSIYSDTSDAAAATRQDLATRVGQRLLQRYGVLGLAEPLPVLNDLAQAAATVASSPGSTILLYDCMKREGFLVGLWGLEAGYEAANGICARVFSRHVWHTIQHDAFFELEDNDIPEGDTKLCRFYAGAIVRSPQGHPLGALCVLDGVSRTLTDAQRRQITFLAKTVTMTLEKNSRLDSRRPSSDLRSAMPHFSNLPTSTSSPPFGTRVSLSSRACGSAGQPFPQQSSSSSGEQHQHHQQQQGLRQTERSSLTSSSSWRELPMEDLGELAMPGQPVAKPRLEGSSERLASIVARAHFEHQLAFCVFRLALTCGLLARRAWALATQQTGARNAATSPAGCLTQASSAPLLLPLALAVAFDAAIAAAAFALHRSNARRWLRSVISALQGAEAIALSLSVALAAPPGGSLADWAARYFSVAVFWVLCGGLTSPVQVVFPEAIRALLDAGVEMSHRHAAGTLAAPGVAAVLLRAPVGFLACLVLCSACWQGDRVQVFIPETLDLCPRFLRLYRTRLVYRTRPLSLGVGVDPTIILGIAAAGLASADRIAPVSDPTRAASEGPFAVLLLCYPVIVGAWALRVAEGKDTSVDRMLRRFGLSLEATAFQSLLEKVEAAGLGEGAEGGALQAAANLMAEAVPEAHAIVLSTFPTGNGAPLHRCVHTATPGDGVEKALHQIAEWTAANTEESNRTSVAFALGSGGLCLVDSRDFAQGLLHFSDWAASSSDPELKQGFAVTCLLNSAGLPVGFATLYIKRQMGSVQESVLLEKIESQVNCLGFTLGHLRAERAKELQWHVTEEMRMRKELAEGTVALQQSFISHMTHELRTPLNAVIAFNSLCLEGGGLNHQDEEYIRSSLTSGQQLLGVVNQILEFAKMESMDPGQGLELNIEPFSLLSIVSDLTDIAGPKATGKDVVLVIDADPGLFELALNGDAFRLRQTLINLTDNATKFTSAGGEVVVRIQPIEGEEDLPARDAFGWPLQWVEFSIRDTGEGMPLDQQHKLFKPFSQIKQGAGPSKAGGTGLGLVITKRIIEAFGGSVSFVSAPGVGTTFFVKIPFVVGKRSGCDPSLPPPPQAVSAESLRPSPLPHVQLAKPVVVAIANASLKAMVMRLLAAWGVRAAEADVSNVASNAGAISADGSSVAEPAKLTDEDVVSAFLRIAVRGDIQEPSPTSGSALLRGGEEEAPASAPAPAAALEPVIFLTEVRQLRFLASRGVAFPHPAICPVVIGGFSDRDDMQRELPAVPAELFLTRPVKAAALLERLRKADAWAAIPCAPTGAATPPTTGGAGRAYELSTSLALSDSHASVGDTTTSMAAAAVAAVALGERGACKGPRPVRAPSGRLAPPPLVSLPPVRCLCAEDNPVNRRVALAVLARCGIEPAFAFDGKQAVEAYEKSLSDPLPFTCIFMDIMMPVLDGLAATETIRRLEAERGVPAVHIIALSASSSTEDMEQAYRSGVNDYVPKPIYPDVVRMALQRWADGRLPQREELEEDSDAV